MRSALSRRVLLTLFFFAGCETNVPAPDGGTGDAGTDAGVNAQDAGTACVPGTTQPCYDGPEGTEDVGACSAGTKTCAEDGSAYGACVGAVLPVDETCTTDVDDDCDGQVNEEGAGCDCVPGTSTPCFTGPPGTLDAGLCSAGTKRCNALGTGYEACMGEVLPSPETCSTPEDDDCDGQVNEEGAGCTCLPNSTASCFTGPAGAENIGLCRAGTMTCNALGTGYGACTGEVLPAPETCMTPDDDDCDGEINEEGTGCTCVPGSMASCFTGPSTAANVGICTPGTMTCNALGTGYGDCVGEVLPGLETCATPEDDDCDGQVNEEGAGCVCLPRSTRSCFTGPAGTNNVGVCKSGTEECNALGTAYGDCIGEVVPVPESCSTPFDDDCDGDVNEGCVCVPDSTSSCFTGPPGLENVGLCRAGTRTCNSSGTAWGACVGEVLPSTESCATPGDDDCDGQTNEGCVCTPGAEQTCYTGAPGTMNVGPCKSGIGTCNAEGTGFDSCLGQVLPVPETCAQPFDEDCDGQVNEGCSGLTCDLLQENFDDGTADSVSGTYEASWCDTVIPTSSNTPLCMTGRTLRTNDSTIDPTLWIHKGQASCTQARVSYAYYQFALAGVTVTYQQSNDTTAVCEKTGTFTSTVSPPTLQQCVLHSVTIPFGTSEGVYVRFEHGAGTNALWLDTVQVELLGCGC